MSRPEQIAPPEIYYDAAEAAKYSDNNHTIAVQSRLTERAMELALLSDERPALVLDIGCGSGISGSVLSEHGHSWLGLDISPAMLGVALQREVEGDLLFGDIGQVHKFRPGSFDAAISVSAIQWLCNADKADHVPFKRLTTFFGWLKSCLAVGARTVFQFYPETAAQADMIVAAATKSGFAGGIVVDYPNSTRAKKYYLCLWTGMTGTPAELPKGLAAGDGEEAKTDRVANAQRQKQRGVGKRKPVRAVHGKEWIQNKKESQRRKDMLTRPDSRYTGRRRQRAFG